MSLPVTGTLSREIEPLTTAEREPAPPLPQGTLSAEPVPAAHRPGQVPLLRILMPLVMVAANTLAQRESPNDVIGRVSSAVDQSFAVPQVFSIAMGAGLVTVVDYRLVLVGMALIMMTGGWYLYNGRVYSAPDRTIEKAA